MLAKNRRTAGIVPMTSIPSRLALYTGSSAWAPSAAGHAWRRESAP